MSIGTWTNADQGSARTTLRNGSGNSTSGTTRPEKNIAKTDESVSSPVWSSSQNALDATSIRIAKLTTTPSVTETRKAR